MDSGGKVRVDKKELDSAAREFRWMKKGDVLVPSKTKVKGTGRTCLFCARNGEP